MTWAIEKSLIEPSILNKFKLIDTTISRKKAQVAIFTSRTAARNALNKEKYTEELLISVKKAMLLKKPKKGETPKKTQVTILYTESFLIGKLAYVENILSLGAGVAVDTMNSLEELMKEYSVKSKKKCKLYYGKQFRDTTVQPYLDQMTNKKDKIFLFNIRATDLLLYKNIAMQRLNASSPLLRKQAIYIYNYLGVTEKATPVYYGSDIIAYKIMYKKTELIIFTVNYNLTVNKGKNMLELLTKFLPIIDKKQDLGEKRKANFIVNEYKLIEKRIANINNLRANNNKRIDDAMRGLQLLYNTERTLSKDEEEFKDKTLVKKRIIKNYEKILNIDRIISLTLNADIITIETEPIIMIWNKMICVIGRLQWSFSKKHIDTFRVINRSQPRGKPHPHISDRICWGNYSQEMGNLLAIGNDFLIVEGFMRFLHSYTAGEAYLEPFKFTVVTPDGQKFKREPVPEIMQTKYLKYCEKKKLTLPKNVSEAYKMLKDKWESIC